MNETAKQQIEQWDRGEGVWSIEMGGLGPGYEQAIQILAIEIMRDEINSPIPAQESWSSWGDATVKRIDPYDEETKRFKLGGFSGAQVGAAKQIAYRFLKDGPKKALESCPDDRRI